MEQDDHPLSLYSVSLGCWCHNSRLVSSWTSAIFSSAVLMPLPSLLMIVTIPYAGMSSITTLTQLGWLPLSSTWLLVHLFFIWRGVQHLESWWWPLLVWCLINRPNHFDMGKFLLGQSQAIMSLLVTQVAFNSPLHRFLMRRVSLFLLQLFPWKHWCVLILLVFYC